MNDSFFENRPDPARYSHSTQPFPYEPERLPLKSKALAVLFSMMVPGTGQMYLGSVTRGMSIMLMIILDIVAIVFFVTKPIENHVLPVTLLALLIPALYFYNLFDAVHQTDFTNCAIRQGIPPGVEPSGFSTGSNGGNLLLGFIGMVVLFCSLSAFGGWWDGIFTVNTAIGGAILVVAGALLFMKELRGKKIF